ANRVCRSPVPPTGRLPVRYNPRKIAGRNRLRRHRSGTKEPAMPFPRRTHTCGELRAAHAGQSVVLNGWVNTRRDQGSLVFINLRDRYGLTQVVFEADKPELVKAAQELRSEFCVAVNGAVSKRLPGKENKNLATGEIEVKATDLVILNRCPT